MSNAMRRLGGGLHRAMHRLPGFPDHGTAESRHSAAAAHHAARRERVAALHARAHRHPGDGRQRPEAPHGG